MDDPRFNDIFNEDFDGNYDDVMNRIVDQINYPSCEGSGASFSVLEMIVMETTPMIVTMTVMMTVTMTVMITMNLF